MTAIQYTCDRYHPCLRLCQMGDSSLVIIYMKWRGEGQSPALSVFFSSLHFFSGHFFLIFYLRFYTCIHLFALEVSNLLQPTMCSEPCWARRADQTCWIKILVSLNVAIDVNIARILCQNCSRRNVCFTPSRLSAI